MTDYVSFLGDSNENQKKFKRRQFKSGFILNESEDYHPLLFWSKSREQSLLKILTENERENNALDAFNNNAILSALSIKSRVRVNTILKKVDYATFFL